MPQPDAVTAGGGMDAPPRPFPDESSGAVREERYGTAGTSPMWLACRVGVGLTPRRTGLFRPLVVRVDDRHRGRLVEGVLRRELLGVVEVALGERLPVAGV